MAKNQKSSLKDTAGSDERWSGAEMKAVWIPANNKAGKRLYTSDNKDDFKPKGYNQPKSVKQEIKKTTEKKKKIDTINRLMNIRNK